MACSKKRSVSLSHLSLKGCIFKIIKAINHKKTANTGQESQKSTAETPGIYDTNGAHALFM